MVVLGSFLLIGCEPKENPILSNEQFPGEKYPPNVLYTPQQEAQLIEAMRTTALGMPHEPLTTAPDDVRWSDVPAAARAAVVAAEMGLVSSTLSGDTWTFTGETTGSAPFELTVERRPAPYMYLATAKVGSFGQDATNAERLVREFRMAMRRLGALKRPS